MKKTNININSPVLGCKVGSAYQIMLGQLSKALKEAGLDITTSEYLVLRAVYATPGLQQCEIADLVGKDKAAVCRCVAGLDKKGLVTTQIVSYKCLKVYPSEAALAIKPRVMAVATARHQALQALVSPDELEVFINVIDKIINSKI